MAEREAYSYGELSARYGVTPRTLRRWRAEGKLEPAFTAGKRVTRLRLVQDKPEADEASR
jgi:transposase-like protein